MPLYELNDIVHTYNGHQALAVEHWQVDGGGITGLFGPNGSGKSTLLKLLSFVERPTSGRILLNGRRTEPFDPAVREMVALLPQQTFLLKRSVQRNVAYGLHLRKARRGVTERVKEAMSLVGLDYERFRHRPWFALSGGEAHRVALATRLALRPKVLLLDEPTTSVDAASAQHIKAAALFAHRQWGSSVIIVSHDIPWLQDICHETAFLFQGQLLGHGHRTLLFGPWQKLDEGHVYMTLDEDQRFVAALPRPHITRQVAAVDPARLSLSTAAGPTAAGRHRLRGLLTSLSLDNLSGRISATVSVGHIVFNTLVDQGTFSDGGFAPGRTVWIVYRPDDVVWF